MSILTKTLNERDLLFQVSNDEVEIKKIYCGFDGTASSLQIGNLTPLAALRHLSQKGIQPIVVLGGATSTVGDPSGKTETRKQLENEAIITNIDIIKSQIQKLVPGAIIVNNFDWLGKLTFMDFLSNVASHVSTSYIIGLKTFASRLANNDPLTIKEIIYPLMQGYDFLWLYENLQCDAQLGGQDQWCNVLTGHHLINKVHKDASVVAVTCPLLTDSNGNKMGKSLKGAIYLSSELCPVYDFWNFWRNIDDSVTRTCLVRFTDIEISEIDDIVSKNINEAKKLLANWMTTWVHSKEDAENSEKIAQTIFVDKDFDKLDLISVSSNKLTEIISSLKNISSSDAKRLIKGNAIKLNDAAIDDITKEINNNEEYILTVGKKDIFKIIKND